MILDEAKFPFPTIREQQREVIEELNKIPDDKKYILLQCGTGTGKSALAVGMSNTIGPSFILTTTKQLQDQYDKDFSKTSFCHIKGKANYPCSFMDDLVMCDAGPCIADSKQIYKCGDRCEYYKIKEKAKNSNIICTNYAYFFTNCGNQDFMSKRPLMVFDEAHNLESQLVAFAELDFNLETLIKKFFDEKDASSFDSLLADIENLNTDDEYHNWLSKVYTFVIKPKYEEIECAISELIGQGFNLVGNGQVHELRKLKEKSRILDNYITKFHYIEDHSNNRWLYSKYSVGDSQYKNIKATPLDAGNIFKEFVSCFADRFVFMSATLLDLNSFADSLGLDRNKCAFINFDSPFPADNAPIIPMNCLDLKYNPKGLDDDQKIELIKLIKKISLAYPDKKGIIHTGNKQITKILYDIYKDNPRFLFRIDNVTNQDIYEKHLKSHAPTILVSSSMIDGVDLYGDLSKFQVIIKLPFLSLGDKRVALKTKLYDGWYLTQTWMRLIQSSGRSIRSETDTADTYILDKAWGWSLKQAKDRGILPKQFLDRIGKNPHIKFL